MPAPFTPTDDGSPIIEFVHTEDHLRALIMHLDRHHPQRRRSIRRRRALLLGLGVLELVVSMAVGLAPLGFVLLMVMSALAGWLPLFWQRQHVRQRKRAGVFGRLHRYQISDDGLLVSSSIGDSRVRWEAIEQITEERDYAFVELRTQDVFYIPREAAPPQVFASFVEQVRQRSGQARLLDEAERRALPPAPR